MTRIVIAVLVLALLATLVVLAATGHRADPFQGCRQQGTCGEPR